MVAKRQFFTTQFVKRIENDVQCDIMRDAKHDLMCHLTFKRPGTESAAAERVLLEGSR